MLTKKQNNNIIVSRILALTSSPLGPRLSIAQGDAIEHGSEHRISCMASKEPEQALETSDPDPETDPGGGGRAGVRPNQKWKH